MAKERFSRELVRRLESERAAVMASGGTTKTEAALP
jgi:hypothetical protein